jgi:hypothetical protein
VDLMRDTGGIVEQINPARLGKTVMSKDKPNHAEHASETSSPNGETLKKHGARKKR